ncbi:MAG: hypothetical protein ACI9SJ_001674 [Flavobacteriaceae bacterium]|jgi:hypothetical protein|uniref:hypothetical protein n=1 Tax=Candidatus Marifrigoribacter sp. Uisw_064 TaxID=3230970 RepID=UPI003AEDCC48
MNLFNNLRIVILLCLTLGLAPYYPEPHIVGKIKWVIGGAAEMKLMDVLDLLLHGIPFILLIRIIYIKVNKTASNNSK